MAMSGMKIKCCITGMVIGTLSGVARAQMPGKALLRGMDTSSTASVLRQPDSRMIFFTATGGNFYSDRLFANGDKDDAYNGIRTSKAAFGPPGQCRTQTAVLDKWNRVLVAGHCKRDGKRAATLVRLDKKGDPDKDFEGMVQTIVADSSQTDAICVLPDEKIITAGTCYASGEARFFLIRHIYNGARDTSFGTKGVRVDSDMPGNSKVTAAVAQWDGRIVVCGYNITDDTCRLLLVRYNTDGGRDYSWGDNGILTVKESTGGSIVPHRMLQTSDEKILIAGTTATKDKGQGVFILRYYKDGKADTTFGNKGLLQLQITGTDRLDDVALTSEGTIIISGAGKMKEGGKAAGQFVLRITDGGVPDSLWGFGSAKGLSVQTVQPGAHTAANTIAVSPLDSKVYAVSEMTVPGAIETMVYLKAFLQDNDLGIIDMADRNKQRLVYPYPAVKNMVMNYELVDSQRVTIKMYDQAEKEVASVQTNKHEDEGEHKFTVNMAALPAGKYEVVMTTSQKLKTTIEFIKP